MLIIYIQVLMLIMLLLYYIEIAGKTATILLYLNLPLPFSRLRKKRYRIMERTTYRVMRDHMRHWKIWARSRRRLSHSKEPDSRNQLHSKSTNKLSIAANNNAWKVPSHKKGSIANDSDIKYLLMRALESLVLFTLIPSYCFIINLLSIGTTCSAKKGYSVERKFRYNDI